MLALIGGIKNFQTIPVYKVWDNDGDQVLAYRRENLLFVYNFNPVVSFTGYGLLVPLGKYKIVLNSDDSAFGGFDSIDNSIEYVTIEDPLYESEKKGWLKLYIPARTAIVLKTKN
jgi:1,4-alpha-glucan branching enzyme